jgi:hypothetical protein
MSVFLVGKPEQSRAQTWSSFLVTDTVKLSLYTPLWHMGGEEV